MPRSTLRLCAAPDFGSLRQLVRASPSTARPGSAPFKDELAVAFRGGKCVGGGGSSRNLRSSISIEPLPPPLPAATTNSRLSTRRKARSWVGPQANAICLFLILMRRHSLGNTKSRRSNHQTLSPLASASLTSKLFTGAFARRLNDI